MFYDENVFLISISILITCLLNEVQILKEKLDLNHFCGLKGYVKSGEMQLPWEITVALPSWPLLFLIS